MCDSINNVDVDKRFNQINQDQIKYMIKRIKSLKMSDSAKEKMLNSYYEKLEDLK